MNKPPEVQEVCRRLDRRTAKLLRRSSIREQRLATVKDSQPLFWVNGQALCVTEMGREMLDPTELTRIAYPQAGNRGATLRHEPIAIGTEMNGTLTLRRVRTVLRRSQQAPEVREAADLLRRERMGEPARLLAFGQRRSGFGIDSFLLVLNDQRAGGEAC